MITTSIPEEYLPKITKTTFLPEGWVWHSYEDGSGCLYCKNGNQSYFVYDCAPYASQGGIEYKHSNKKDWRVFWGSLQEYKEFAEKEIAKKIYIKNDLDEEKIV